MEGTFKLSGSGSPTATTTWGDTATVKNIGGKEYEFTIDVWDTWYNSDLDYGDTLGQIIIDAGGKRMEITVVIEGIFDVVFHY